MSGHNKWSTIKHKKARTDAKRGKAFSRISKEIILAAKMGGGDPDGNPRLRAAINAAKAVNYPNDNIDRSIKKGTGELEGVTMDELLYEAYAPGGVALIIECLTDNRNRTAADIRHLMTKAGGSLASSGAVSFMFHRKARFLVEGESANEDDLMMLFLENDVDVEAINMLDDAAEIIAPPEAFNGVVECLESANITATESGVVRIPDNLTPVNDEKTARQIMKLLDAIEDYDDVQNVFSNVDIPDELAEQLED